MLGEGARGAQDEIVGERSSRPGGRALDRERQAASRLEAQPVATSREGDDAVEFMQTVVAPREHMQGEIDLGGRLPAPRRRNQILKPSAF